MKRYLLHSPTTWKDLEYAEKYLTKNLPDEEVQQVALNAEKDSIASVAAVGWLMYSLMSGENRTNSLDLEGLVSNANGTEMPQGWYDQFKALQDDEALQQLIQYLETDELVELISDFCIGREGLFSDDFFTKHGEQVVHTLLFLIQSQTEDERFADKQQILEKAAYVFLLKLPPFQRTEVLVLLAKASQKYRNSDLVWEHVFVDVLYEFVLGKKLLQMEKLLPPQMRELASVAKESGRPTSKFHVRDVLEAEGRKDKYAGIGKLAGAASTATVYELLDRTPDEATDETAPMCSTVIKILNEGVLAALENEKIAFLEAIMVLLKENLIKTDINVSDTFSQIVRMVENELSILTESANIKTVSTLRKNRLQNGVAIPKLEYRSMQHLEMSIAPGYSLQKVLKGDVPPEYQQIDMRRIAITVVSDYFAQVFQLGIYNTDEHAGNVFISLNQESRDPQVTIIDHGQVGIADDYNQKKELMILTLALDRRSLNLLAEVIFTRCNAQLEQLRSMGGSDDTTKEHIEMLAAVQKDQILKELGSPDKVPSLKFMVKKTEELSIRYGISMDLVNFAKGLLSVASLMEHMSIVDRSKIALPYVRQFRLEPLIIRNSRELSTTTIRRVMNGDMGRIELV